MFVNSFTDAAPLAVLPGLLCDSRLFAAQLAVFPEATVVGDHYDGASSLAAMAERALAGLPPRFSLLGHSMGGRIALEVWRRAPQRVARLALANTGVHPVGAGEAAKRHALRDLGTAHGMAALVAEWLPPMIGTAGRSVPGLPERLAAMCEEAGLAVYSAQIAALLGRPAAAPLLPTITCPTLVITGSEDSWAPPAQHAAIAAAIPGARLAVVPGAGHMLPAEDPAAFNAALAAWLAEPVRSPHTHHAHTTGEDHDPVA